VIDGLGAQSIRCFFRLPGPDGVERRIIGSLRSGYPVRISEIDSQSMADYPQCSFVTVSFHRSPSSSLPPEPKGKLIRPGPRSEHSCTIGPAEDLFMALIMPQ
jgi:hypothetical protein